MEYVSEPSAMAYALTPCRISVNYNHMYTKKRIYEETMPLS